MSKRTLELAKFFANAAEVKALALNYGRSKSQGELRNSEADNLALLAGDLVVFAVGLRAVEALGLLIVPLGLAALIVLRRIIPDDFAPETFTFSPPPCRVFPLPLFSLAPRPPVCPENPLDAKRPH